MRRHLNVHPLILPFHKKCHELFERKDMKRYRDIAAVRQSGKFAAVVYAAALCCALSAQMFAAPAFVQRNSATPQSMTTSVSVAYSKAQVKGNLNVVVVGWNDNVAAVQSVRDTAGNSYAVAVGPTIGTALQQSVYYATNIVAGSNTVIVTFNQAAAYPDVRILEYSGVGTLDVTAGASGNSSTANSGAMTTRVASELIFGANTVATSTRAAGTGFTSRIITSPDGDIAEDKVVSVAGSNSASASLNSAGAWVMQMATFSATVSTAPTITSVSPKSGSTVGGTAVTITGTNFATGASVTFGSAAATSISVVNNTTISATTPAGTAGAVSVTVTVNGQNGSLANGFTYVAMPTVTNVNPSTGTTSGGTAVTITGTNFVSGATVTFGSASATSVVVVNSTTITAVTPAGSAGAVTVIVTVSSQSGTLPNGYTYTLTPDFTLSASPGSVTVVSGNQGASTITSTVSGGFNSSISLSASGVPTGATVSFGPTTIAAPGSGTSSMTLTVGSSTAVGTYTITVAGSGGGLQRNTTVILIVTSSTPKITYIQGNYATPQSAQSSVAVKFNLAQNAGDLNVVVVGWNDSTATVSSVADSAGNSYTRAIGPNAIAGTLSQSIYYAKNIVSAAAGANTVTVTFSVAAAFPDIRILEYQGIDPSAPVDVTSASSGNGSLSSSGSATTTSPVDLLFAANIVTTITSGAGSGFTSRLLTSPDSDIAEDEVVNTVGSYPATAPLSPGSWIMQMIAFRAIVGSIPVAALSPSSINFGNVQTGVPSSPQPVVLTNIGGANLNIKNIGISGGNASDFSEINNCGSVLLPNGNCTINVTFTPTNTGARSSSLSTNDDAPGSPQSVPLSGNGTGFAVTPRNSVVTFAMTQQFTATAGGVTWSVDGIVGGSASIGTISSAGLYTPPSSVGMHVVTGTTSTSTANATVYVSNYPGTFTFHNDNMRTGQNNSETVLTPANVSPSQFGKLFSYSVDGITYASPLYLANVNIPGQGHHNVVYVATEHDSLYAFDADGLTANPLWHVSFLGSGVTTVPCGDVGECGDIPNEIGITSTPVIDPTTSTIYLVAKTKEGTKYVQRLHALDVTTGAEKFGGPVVLSGSVPGNGTGSSGGNLAFSALRENQRTGLLLSGGVIYFAFGSHGDQSPWHGWVLGYNASTLQQVLIYNATPNGNGGGIWQSGGGLATDSSGGLYFTTSNGDFDVDAGGIDYGDSIVKLSPSATVMDYFTPHDQSALSTNNLDFGSAGPVLLVDQTSGPYPHLLVTAGKNGTIYVVNRDNMGHFNPGNDNQIVQSLVGALPNGDQEIGNFSAPVYFNGYVYFAAVNDSLKAFQLISGTLSTSPTSQSGAIYPVRGGSFAVSANGNSNGILWAVQNNDVTAPGVLFAYDATNLADELYDSSQMGNRDTLDVASKFTIPLVANGKVFVSSQSQLTAYGLLP